MSTVGHRGTYSICGTSLCILYAHISLSQLSAFVTRNSVDEHIFVRTHLSTYFICLLLCDCLQGKTPEPLHYFTRSERLLQLSVP